MAVVMMSSGDILRLCATEEARRPEGSCPHCSKNTGLAGLRLFSSFLRSQVIAHTIFCKYFF